MRGEMHTEEILLTTTYGFGFHLNILSHTIPRSKRHDLIVQKNVNSNLWKYRKQLCVCVCVCVHQSGEAPCWCSYCYGNQEWFYCNLANQSIFKCLQLSIRLTTDRVNLSRWMRAHACIHTHACTHAHSQKLRSRPSALTLSRCLYNACISQVH